MQSPRNGLLVGGTLALGLAVGTWAGRAYAPEPTWAQALSDRLAEQEELLHQQERAIDGLTGAVAELRSSGLRQPDVTCITGADLRAALEGHGRGAAAGTTAAPRQPEAIAETAAASRDARDSHCRCGRCGGRRMLFQRD